MCGKKNFICMGGGITVKSPARLYSPVLVPTVIPQFSLMAQCFFDLEIRRKSCLLAALIYSHPLFHFPNPFQTLTQLCQKKNRKTTLLNPITQSTPNASFSLKKKIIKL